MEIKGKIKEYVSGKWERLHGGWTQLMDQQKAIVRKLQKQPSVTENLMHSMLITVETKTIINIYTQLHKHMHPHILSIRQRKKQAFIKSARENLEHIIGRVKKREGNINGQ